MSATLKAILTSSKGDKHERGKTILLDFTRTKRENLESHAHRKKKRNFDKKPSKKVSQFKLTVQENFRLLTHFHLKNVSFNTQPLNHNKTCAVAFNGVESVSIEIYNNNTLFCDHIKRVCGADINFDSHTL